MVRFGLIPRFVDPFPRPELATGKLVSVATGSSEDSSVTFTLFGNILVLGGWGVASLVVTVAAIATAVSLLLRKITPMRMALVVGLVINPLWIESTYPDFVAGVLQGWVSTAAALLMITVVRSVDEAVTTRFRLR
jgi:hypothetical protein